MNTNERQRQHGTDPNKLLGLARTPGGKTRIVGVEVYTGFYEKEDPFSRSLVTSRKLYFKIKPENKRPGYKLYAALSEHLRIVPENPINLLK